MKIIITGHPMTMTYACKTGGDFYCLKVKGNPAEIIFDDAREALEAGLALLAGLRTYILDSAKLLDSAKQPEEEGDLMRVWDPSHARILFQGRLVDGAPYSGWHRVIPEGHIDLSPKYKVEKA